MSLTRLLTAKYILLFICLLFLVTRIYKISEIPPSVYWDEASIGFNAYSIAQTGKDEWGDFFPIHFRAFGEFKLPVYIYSTVLFVNFFGLNEFSVRIPSVMFSLGVVIITFLLAKRLTGSGSIGAWSSFFLIVSPWFFIFSRTGYEATAGLMFYLLGIYTFLSTKNKRWLLLISTVSFILSAYSYNSFRIIVPLTITILILYEFNKFKQNFKGLIIPVFLFISLIVISVIPIYRLYKFDAGSSRFQTVVVKGNEIITNYFSHFSFSFLFKGDKNLRSQQGGFGQTNLSEVALFLVGLILCLKSTKKYLWLPVILFLIGPIPAAITNEAPHALRAIPTVPFIAIISATGANFLQQKFKQKYLISSVLVIISIVFFINYLINFINFYSLQSSEEWQYGYKKIFTEYKVEFDKYNRVIISDKYAQPYIFALFYLNYDPNKFREGVVRNTPDQWSFSAVSRFDKFEFRKINSLVESDFRNTLVFTGKNEENPKMNESETIRFLNGDIAFKVYGLR